jgi:hypothetical protein
MPPVGTDALAQLSQGRPGGIRRAPGRADARARLAYGARALGWRDAAVSATVVRGSIARRLNQDGTDYSQRPLARPPESGGRSHGFACDERERRRRGCLGPPGCATARPARQAAATSRGCTTATALQILLAEGTADPCQVVPIHVGESAGHRFTWATLVAGLSSRVRGSALLTRAAPGAARHASSARRGRVAPSNPAPSRLCPRRLRSRTRVAPRSERGPPRFASAVRRGRRRR